VAALVTLITFVFNYRATIGNQHDTQFYEALKRFGDQTSSVLRSSAAGLLAQMASRTNLLRRPYFDTTLDQLGMGLRIETDPIVLVSVSKALLQLAHLNPFQVLATLREINIELQADLTRSLASFLVLHGSDNTEYDESLWKPAIRLTSLDSSEIVALIEASHNARLFKEAFDDAVQNLPHIRDSQRVDVINELSARLQLVGQRLRRNCGLVKSVLSSLVPFISTLTKLTREGYRTFRRVSIFERYRDRGFRLDRMFLPGISLIDRFISGMSFEQSVLVAARFQNSLILDTTFAGASLRGASFSASLLRSSKVGKTAWGGWRSINPTSFHSTGLQDVDFRGTEFVATMMYEANMASAKMFAASIAADDERYWNGANWWTANYDEGDFVPLDREAANITTNRTMVGLYKHYREDLPTDAGGLHLSVRRFLAAAHNENAL
jgi:uncharacterized protein YjbI with pentapeptide repeats